MGRTFGKYRSRRSKQAAKKEAEAKRPETDDEAPESSEELSESEENPKGGALFSDVAETGEDYLDQMHKDTQGALGGLLPNRLHVDKMDSDLLPKVVSVLDDHQFKGLKHAAKYILGHPTDTVFHHRHRASQPMKHFKQIAESKRHDLARELSGSDKMHRAVHEAMHSAHLGGGFDFSHAIHVAKHIADPIQQVVAAKDEYDQIDTSDWSAKGVASNAGHALAGNTRMAAAHMKATSIVAPEAAPMLLPASEGFVGMSKAASYSTKLL